MRLSISILLAVSFIVLEFIVKLVVVRESEAVSRNNNIIAVSKIDPSRPDGTSSLRSCFESWDTLSVFPFRISLVCHKNHGSSFGLGRELGVEVKTLLHLACVIGFIATAYFLVKEEQRKNLSKNLGEGSTGENTENCNSTEQDAELQKLKEQDRFKRNSNNINDINLSNRINLSHLTTSLHFCLLAIVTGGAGNLIDRLIFGYVVDYLQWEVAQKIKFGDLLNLSGLLNVSDSDSSETAEAPSYLLLGSNNVADVLITCGCAGVLAKVWGV